ncbi:hypothetical protein FBY04_1234 [Pseudomonas sp. SJZ080]|uniref:hypothetical protein n=1 Tax=Pseudomonas sp. SJZ080 TaxID=2572888 RepID=UPI00119A0DA8|nr:hypothetical protein [Pseudomonas sp. SJZ080]TWC48883.1 hypothetical protein FBY04_1234 [Pseudomonas sp. SJZ080]
MVVKNLAHQARAKYGAVPHASLKWNETTSEAPMELFITDEHTENFLSLKTGGDTDRGLLTGVMAFGSIPCLLIALWLLANGNYAGAGNALIVATPLVLIPFFWEIFRRLPLPIMFNRRTREVYFDNNGELFHAPWDGMEALTCEFQMVGPYTAGMKNSSLEIMVQRFGDPENALMISLGSPIGKTLEMQKGFWEYIRAYMNNGPWFDKNGNSSNSDTFIKDLLASNLKQSEFLGHTLQVITEKKAAANGKNYLSGIDAAMFLGNLFFHPLNLVQDFTYKIAKRRSRNRWPKIVLERLQSDGPTTRLVDIEK